MSRTSTPSSRPSGVLLAALATLALVLSSMAVAPRADGQVAVTGSADFRSAPQLGPGTYNDRIVTGDSAWYAILYTNGTPYEFTVEFQGNPPPGVELTASLVAPTLATVDGPSTTVTGSGVTYPVGQTNLWFLKVSLETVGQAGVEYPVLVTVNGVESVGTEDCSQTASCTLDDELAALTQELSDARSEAEAVNAQETTTLVQASINGSLGFLASANDLLPAADARLNRAEATMADLCNPDPFCDPFPDPGTTTPILGWLVGLAALAGGGYIGFKKLTRQRAAEPATA